MSDTVKFSGPMFDGRAEAALNRGIHAIREAVADRGKNLAAAAFTSAIRDNHGDFVRRFVTTDASRTYQTGEYTLVVTTDTTAETLVTTDLATYGPWLEGTGSRNESTRFKGYHGMRMASQALGQVAGVLGDEAIRPYVAEMSD